MPDTPDFVQPNIYLWDQTDEQVIITLPVPELCKAHDLDIAIQSQYIRAGVKGQPAILKGKLFLSINSSKSHWQIENDDTDASFTASPSLSMASSYACLSSPGSPMMLPNPMLGESFAEVDSPTANLLQQTVALGQSLNLNHDHDHDHDHDAADDTDLSASNEFKPSKYKMISLYLHKDIHGVHWEIPIVGGYAETMDMDPTSAHYLGQWFESRKKNTKRAFEHFLYAAERGHSRAMVKVASLYDVDQRNDMQGLATDLTYEYPKKDAQKAFHWYKRAADREGFMSDVMACYIVGNTFTSGSPQAGVEKNDRLALRYYERCMLLTGPQIDLDMNVVDGVIPESQLRSRSPRSGNEHYFCSAAFQSGLILFSGSKNGKEQPSSGSDSLVEVDLVRAMRYWKQASMLGHAQASYNIGIMYAKGIGVEQDSFEAGKWFARALHLDDTRKLVVPAHIKLRNWNASKEELGDSLPVQQEQQQPSKPSSSPFSSSGSSSKPMSNAATTSTAKSTRRRERKKPIDYPDMDDSRGKIVALSSAAAVAGTIVWWYMKAHK